MSWLNKTIAATTALLLGPLLSYGLAAIIFAAIATGRAENAALGDIVIHIRGNAVHAEFVFPVRNRIMDWSALTPASDFRSPPLETSHVSFGWGEREFYARTPHWSDFDWRVGLHALSYGDDTVLHVTRLSSVGGYPWIRRLEVTEAQYKGLVEYVLSFYRAADGRPAPLVGMAYGGDDVFYKARGTYSPFMTCNEWVNRGLRSSGLNAALWSPFSFGLKWALPK